MMKLQVRFKDRDMTISVDNSMNMENLKRIIRDEMLNHFG